VNGSFEHYHSSLHRPVTNFAVGDPDAVTYWENLVLVNELAVTVQIVT
jgi:hypothetical protein